MTPRRYIKTRITHKTRQRNARDFVSVERSEMVAHSMRHVHIMIPDESPQGVATTSLFETASGGIDKSELENDHSGYASPVSSQNSVDQLAEKYAYGETGASSDGEQPHNISNDRKVNEHATKIAQGYIVMREHCKKLKAKHASHWAFAEAVQNEKAALEGELKQLKTCSVLSEKENGQLKERIQHLESDIKDKKAITEMLQYGTQSKCGVCSKNCKIIDSHPYSKVVLDTVFGADYLGILDLQQDQFLQPSTCKWKHLCGECDQVTGGEEKRFKDCLVTVLEDCTSATNEKILLSQADLFHVYTFRALLRNVDIYHYIPGLEEDQGCTCSRLLHSLNDFRKRAHHLGKQIVWKSRGEDQSINPSEAGMLFHVCPSDIPPDHWIEFPVICKVQFESDQRSDYLIFAQIPPFYWAFPLPVERQDVPDTISDDMITSKILVERHYKQAMSDASQLSKHFEQIVAGVNKELQAKRKSFNLDDRLQKWRDNLKKKKEDVLNKGRELKAEGQVCKEEQEELHKRIDKIEENREKNKIRMKETRKDIEKLENKVKKTHIAKDIKVFTHEIGNLAAEQRKITRDNQELSKTEIECNEQLEKNASQREELCAKKLELIKQGLHADLEPKLMIGYFRIFSLCYLKIHL